MAVFTAIGAYIFGAGSFLAGLTAAGLQIAAGIGLSLIGKAIAGEPEPQRFGVQGRIQGGDAVPRSIIFGYASTAGSYVWGNTWGTANGVPNAYITQVIALADYPIRSLVGFIANDIPSDLGATAHPQYGRPVLGYRKGDVDHMWVKFYDGTQTAADPFLVNTVSSTSRPWGANRIGRGVPYVIVTCMAPERKDGEEKPLFQNGLPRFQFVVEGSRLFDPSNPAHIYEQPATWGGDGDFLPVVQAYNLMRGIRFNGEWLYGLQSLPAARLPTAAWVNEITKCRTPITGPNGPEPTYRTGGEIQVGAQIKFALEAMLTGCQGRLTETGGTYKPFVGEPNAPVMSFSDGDILSTEEQTFTPFYGLEDTINGIQATYPNPSEGWNDKTAPPLLRSDLEVLDGNRRLLANVSLDMVPYGGQVQRLMQSALREAQRARRHTITMGPEFWVLEPGDYIVWDSARNGYIDKLFRVDGIADQPDLNVLLDITEVDPSDYDWNQDEDFRPVVDGPLQLIDTPPLPAIGWQVYGAIVLDDQGRARRPGIEVAYQSGLQGVEQVRIQVRNVGAAEPFIDILVAYGNPWRTQITGNFPPNTTYEVRGIYVGTPAEWSAWLEVTTPDVKLLPGEDFDPFGDVDLSALSDDIREKLKWYTMSVRELIEAVQNQDTQISDQDAGNALMFEEIRREVSISLNDVNATFSEIVTVAIVPLQEGYAALSDQLVQLTATVGDIASSVTMRSTAVADPGGGWARWGVEVKTGSGDNWSSAAMYLDTNGTLSRAVFLVDQFVIAGSDGSLANPLVIDSEGLRINNAMVRSASIADAAIIRAKIANAAVGSAQIEDAAITRAKIGSAAVGSAEIENAAITNAKIGNLEVDRIKIANGAVTDFPQDGNYTPQVVNAAQTRAGPNFITPNGPFIAAVNMTGSGGEGAVFQFNAIRLVRVSNGAVINLSTPGNQNEFLNLNWAGVVWQHAYGEEYRLEVTTDARRNGNSINWTLTGWACLAAVPRK